MSTHIVVHRPITLGFGRPVTHRFQASLGSLGSSLTVHFPTRWPDENNTRASDELRAVIALILI